MATGIGSVIAFTAKRTNFRFLSIATGFSAGVMLYVSFVEIFVKGGAALALRYGEPLASWINVASFFAGMLLIGLIDNLIPAAENPHETHAESETRPLHDPNAPLPDFEHADASRPKTGEISIHDHAHHHHKLMRMGLFTALAIGIHNFPEGLATFMAAISDPALGVSIAIAIALHNIPEGLAVGVAFGAVAAGLPEAGLAGAMSLALGIGLQNLPEGAAVSMPLRGEGVSRRKAFLVGQASGLVEPIAGVIGAAAVVVMQPLLPYALAFAAGAMVFVVVEEVVPESQSAGHGDWATMGLIAGFTLMMILDVAFG